MYRQSFHTRNSSTTPCRNGANCRFLQRGTCWFYHPQSHKSTARNRQSENSFFQELQRRRQASENQRRQQERARQLVVRHENLLSLLQSIRSERIQRLSLSNQDPESTGSQELKEDASLDCPVSCSLSGNLKWFFRRNRHIKVGKNLPKEYESCSICCQEYECEDLSAQNYLTQLFCKHSFHSECIQKWFQHSQACPLCKKDFRDHTEYADWDKDYKKHIKKSDVQRPLVPFLMEDSWASEISSQSEPDYDYIYHGYSDHQWQYDYMDYEMARDDYYDF